MQGDRILAQKYIVIEQLAEGGTSHVYLIRDVKSGMMACAKQISKKGWHKELAEKEMKMLRNIEHPNLPKLLDYIEDDDNAYIITDYFCGETLEEKIKKQKSFDEYTVALWSKQIASAIKYLHQLKEGAVIYRDIKPSNVIVSEGDIARLVDFGSARRYNERKDNDTIYTGTIGYAPPEQFGLGQTGPYSDIYSLGVLMHQLLSGKDPNTPPYVLKPLNFYGKKTSPEMQELLIRCTAADTGLRIKNADEIIIALDQIIDNTISGSKKNHRSTRADYLKKTPDKMRVAQKKLILAVWGNSEFGCEFSYVTAKLTGKNVIIADLELLSPKADLLLGVPKYAGKGKHEYISGSSGLCAVMDSLERNYFSPSIFKEATSIRPEVDNLYVLTGSYNIENYEYFSNEHFNDFVDKAYAMFDIVVLIVSKSIYDSFTAISLVKSDYNLIAAEATVDNIREYNSYISFLCNKQNIDLEKNKFIGFQYSKNIHLDRDTMIYMTANNFIGNISFSQKRVKYRNLSTPYVKHMEKQIIAEYSELIKKLNIC